MLSPRLPPDKSEENNGTKTNPEGRVLKFVDDKLKHG